MSQLITLIKSNIIKQTRSYIFFMIMGISIFLGLLCVPGASSNYEIFYLGGVRGVYNSAWLGVLSAVLPVMLLWLPGFYLLRSQITEDKALKIGQMIASSPVSKTQYILGKLITNFSILMVLQLIFLVAIMMMQLIQHESTVFSILDYILPLVYVTIPYLLVLASLTILFDVVPFLKGVFGNTVIFILWLVFSTVSIANPRNCFDLFGLGTLLDSMLEGAREYFPNLPDAVSFGYYTATSKSTFVWDGISWSPNFLMVRLIWIGVAALITELSVLVFNRFREDVNTKKVKSPKNKINHLHSKSNTNEKTSISASHFQAPPRLSTVKRGNRVPLFGMLLGELKIMLRGHSVWWYLIVLTSIALTPFVTSGDSEKWIAVSMLLPLSIWAQMGNREKICGTESFILSSCPAPTKWLVTWLAGVIIALMMSLGMFAKIILLSQWHYLLPWMVGAIFIPTLALLLGGFSGNGTFFEALFIALMYFGPINSMGPSDFMGLTGSHAPLYINLTIILFIIGLATQIFKEKRLIHIGR